MQWYICPCKVVVGLKAEELEPLFPDFSVTAPIEKELLYYLIICLSRRSQGSEQVYSRLKRRGGSERRRHDYGPFGYQLEI